MTNFITELFWRRWWHHLNAFTGVIVLVIIHAFLYCRKVVTSEAVHSSALATTKLKINFKNWTSV